MSCADHLSGGFVHLEGPGFELSVRPVADGMYLAEVVASDPPNDRVGTSGGGGGDGKGPQFPGEPSDRTGDSRSKCISRNAILFAASSGANLVGAYSAFSEVSWERSVPWYRAGVQWAIQKTRSGLAHPGDYWQAFRENSDFRHNNVWNAVLMGTLTGVECFLGKEKSNAIVTTVAFLSSVAGQMMTKGEISLSQTVLDVAFVRFASLPRARAGAWIDKRVFQRHSPLARVAEVSAYYLGDQYLGGFGYGLCQKGIGRFWPRDLEVTIGSRSVVPLTPESLPTSPRPRL